MSALRVILALACAGALAACATRLPEPASLPVLDAASRADAETLALYVKVLAPLSYTEIEAAVLRIMRTAKFFPTAAEIFEAAEKVGKTLKFEGLREWDILREDTDQVREKIDAAITKAQAGCGIEFFPDALGASEFEPVMLLEERLAG